MHKKALWSLLAALMILSMLVSACVQATPTTAPVEPEAPAATQAPAKPEATAKPEEPAPAAKGEYVTRAYAGEFKGTVVTMAGPFVDEDAVKFNNSIKAFEDTTGIDIQYEGSKEFEASISIRVEAGDAPDIADFPQPGLLANFAKQGKVVDVLSFLSEDYLKGQYAQGWLDMAKMQGADGPIVGGVWHRFNAKSQVWYPKDDFDAAGYTVPTTWEEMMALTQQIADDGDAAWCVGIESGAATGWPATDWIEDILLRTTTPENYDKWTRGELPFSSPEVKRAAEILGEIWQNDAYVYGGSAAVVTTFFGDAPTPMFENPPKCWLHRQGNFITSFFPAEAKAGVDYDFFYLPPIDAESGKPYLVAGDIMAMFNDRPEVRAVMEFFTTGEAVKEWLAAGGALSPHKDASLDWYGDDVERSIAALVAESTTVRFDGSDIMPGEVGSGSFWKAVTDWLSGSIDLDTALAEIDASWPACAPTAGGTGGTTQEESLLDKALAGEFKGTVVTMAGPFTDEDAVKFDNTVKAFEEASGIDIQYEGSKEFEASISIRVEAGDAPDIVDFPQPGLLANFAKQGKVVDVLSFLSEDYLKGQYAQGWLDMAKMQGADGPIVGGVWHRFNAKSQVWYPKDDFDAAGYTVPTTWEEMMALTQQIADDGDAAWCVGIESGAATGWPATDWIEDILLRTTTPENYDKWTRGELPFSSPEVKRAAEILGEIWQNDAYVYGGSAAVVTTFFGDAPTPMFENPPKCWLHRQGNFITSFFPAEAKAGVDYDFFYLPPIDAESGKPYLVAGDIMAMFNDRPEVRAVMEFFTTGEAVKEWLAAGGALSPHKDASLDWYGDDVERSIAALVAESTTVRFDGSDIMPGEVGSGSFWKAVTDWLSGSIDLDTALAEIDASWPK